MKKPKIKFPKPIQAWAVVPLNRPRLKVNEIYDSKDVKLEKGEKLIKIIISCEN
jgi:hypothetical protein